MEYGGRSTPTVMQKDRFLQRARTLVEANLSDPDFGVGQLSAALSYSRQQVYNKIKHCTNKSPSQWITFLRLEKSKVLLLQTDQPIAEIAQLVGFATLSSFSVAFKRTFGLSPHAFRLSES